MEEEEDRMSKLRLKFLEVYQVLKSQLIDDHDPAFEWTNNDYSRQWVDRSFTNFFLVFLLLDHNKPGGNLNRGLSVLQSYKILKEGKLTDDEIFLASALGWCIEWLQAYFVVLDEILDKPHTKRDRAFWFKVPKVRMAAANDGVILRHQIQRVLKKHFKDKKYYVDLLDLFSEVEFQTAYGQMNNLLAIRDEEKDLSKYSMDLYRRIVQYKTSNYSYYLSFGCALLMSGENLEDHRDAKNILLEMGKCFQVQIDYQNCFGEPQNGKTGTDIEDFKCSWLVVKAIELCNDEQKTVLHENYGNQDPACVAKVKELYNDLNLQGEYADYKSQSYGKLMNSIEAHPSKLVQAVLKSFLFQVYKRQR